MPQDRISPGAKPGATPPRVSRWPPLAAFAVVIVLGAGWTIRDGFRQQREQAEARLQSLAELRTSQIESWIDRQLMLAGFLSRGPGFADQFTQWQAGDAEAGRRLLQRMAEFRQAKGADSVLLTDATGQVLASEHPAPEVDNPTLTATVEAAVAQQQVLHTSLYRQADDARMPVRLDVVVPLLHTAPTRRGVVVLRVDPRRSLFPMLVTWAVPSDSGESVLWEQRGDRIVSLSDLRSHPGGAGMLEQPLATSTLPAALCAVSCPPARWRPGATTAAARCSPRCGRCVARAGGWSRRSTGPRSRRRPGLPRAGRWPPRRWPCSAWAWRCGCGRSAPPWPAPGANERVKTNGCRAWACWRRSRKARPKPSSPRTWPGATCSATRRRPMRWAGLARR